MSTPEVPQDRALEKVLIAMLSAVATFAVVAVAGVVRTAPTLEYRVGLIERQVREIHAVLIPTPKVNVHHGEEEDHSAGER